MIKLLARIFIKNSGDCTNPSVRRKYGILCSSFGIFLNIILFLSKLLGAALSSSVSILADAFNNLSDAASSFVSVLGFKLSGKKPDAGHPFGHGRIEYVSGLMVSFLILFMGIELLKSSVGSIMNPRKINGGLIPVCVTLGSILVKLYMFVYNHRIAKKIDSPTMEAVALDSFSDMISTSVVLVSLIASRFTDFPVDGIGGVIVAIFILKTGFDSCRETIDPLLGKAPDKRLVSEIEAETLKISPISGIHDLIIHDYGPGRRMISLHAEVPGNMDIFVLHETIDHAERILSEKFQCNALIHMDPIDMDNKRLAVLKKIVSEESRRLDPRFTVHDIRMVPGEKQTNLIFDIVRPHDCKLTEAEIKSRLADAVKCRENDICCVITVDSPFVSE